MSRHLEGKLEPGAGSCCPGPSQGGRGGERIQLLHPEHSSGFLQTFQVPALSLQLFPEIHMQIGCVLFTPKFVVKSLRWCSSQLSTYGVITSSWEKNSPKSPGSNRNSPLFLWLWHEGHIVKGTAHWEPFQILGVSYKHPKGDFLSHSPRVKVLCLSEHTTLATFQVLLFPHLWLVFIFY